MTSSSSTSKANHDGASRIADARPRRRVTSPVSSARSIIPRPPALERALKSAPDEQDRLAPALDGWREHSVAAFLSAYRQSLSDTRLWPRSPEDADRLLDFFLLEKAFYEIEYELAHRPDWLRVPLAGTLRILSRSEGTPG